MLGADCPNKALLIAAHSPFAAKFVRSQSGTKLPFTSFQVRDAFDTTAAAGCSASRYVVLMLDTYRPNEPLIAVLPLPNTSYAAPMRGVTSLKFGTLSSAP